MQKPAVSSYILIFLLLSITLFIFCESFVKDISASPSFVRQEMTDNIEDLFNFSNDYSRTDWFNFSNYQENNESESIVDVARSIDILRTNYASDGRTLNATLWLSEPVRDLCKDIRYGMNIDTDFNDQTGMQGIDYQLNIRCENGTWTKRLVEWSSLDLSRVVEEIKNYTDFFGNVSNELLNRSSYGGYILLSVNLDAISLPDNYRVLFYAVKDTVKEGHITGKIIDYSDWAIIPPPKLLTSVSPNPIELRAGEQKNIEVQVKSNTGFETNAQLYTNPPSGITLKFSSPELKIPSFGMAASRLSISVAKNDDFVGPHTIPIFVKTSFPTEAVFDRNSAFGLGFGIPSSAEGKDTIEQSSFLVTVGHSLPIHTQLLQLLNELQFPITFIVGIVTGHIGPWLFKTIKDKRERTKYKNFK